ncbi:hypothetical protein Tco_0607777, partial [Tanacetum coccineum]
MVISSALSTAEKSRLLEVLKNHKGAITWSITDIKGIDSSFCTHKILMEDEFKPSVQPQRRVNPDIKEERELKNNSSPYSSSSGRIETIKIQDYKRIRLWPLGMSESHEITGMKH